MDSSGSSSVKVFGIGDNKTGTTTLEAVLQDLGRFMPEQWRQETTVMPGWLRGDYSEFHALVSLYDAFQDAPFSMDNTYVACDALFPSSKFILTVRDPDEWFASLCRFHGKIWGFQDLRSLTEADIKAVHYLYPGYIHAVTAKYLTVIEDGQAKVRWDLLYDRDFYVARHNQRNAEIRMYFANRPDDFLQIDISREANTRRICDFLGLAGSSVGPMPHKNRSR